MHCHAENLNSRWLKRDGRLVCQLRPIEPALLPYLECEPVADRAEIELCILTPPRQAPQLAEVVFPGSMSIQDAKEYIYREMEELSIEAADVAIQWIDSPTGPSLQFGERQLPQTVAVALCQGVTERVALRVGGQIDQAEWVTVQLDFDCAAGWNLAKAVAWVAKHLHVRALGAQLS